MVRASPARTGGPASVCVARGVQLPQLHAVLRNGLNALVRFPTCHIELPLLSVSKGERLDKMLCDSILSVDQRVLHRLWSGG
jgi:hypothetical protein